MTNNDTDKELNDTLRRIFSKGKIKPITWEWDEEWSPERRLQYACDLASSMNQAADIMQKEKIEVYKELEMAQKKQAMAEELQEIDHRTLAEVITTNNAKQQEDAALIQTLQARIKVQDEVIEVLNGNNG